MLDLPDERWSKLLGGYREPFDPRPAMQRLQAGDMSAWEDLWNHWHHQGDVDLASWRSK